ncbi:MAG: luciferase family protein, partial [Betaproteobacteria bacterium]
AHPTDSTHHPNRSPSSPWIEVRFTKASEVARTAELVKLAIAQLTMATK